MGIVSRYQSVFLLLVFVQISGCNSDSDPVGSVSIDDPPKTLNRQPVWSPSGLEIAFTHNAVDLNDAGKRGPWQIWKYSIASETAAYVAAGRSPTWSPSSSAIAYIRDGDVWVFDLESDQETRMTQLGDAVHPKWSPVGDEILFQYGFFGLQRTLWTVSVPDGQVTDLGVESTTANWFPDATSIVLTALGEKSLHVLSLPDNTIHEVIDVAPSNLRHPAVHPLGGKVAFLRFGGGLPIAILQVDLDSGDASEFLARGHQFSWSPQGDKVVYERLNDEGEEYELWVLDLTSQESYQLPLGPLLEWPED